MPLKLERVLPSDFETMTNHGTIHPLGDDLFGPGISVCWPATTLAEPQARLAYHMFRQHQRFLTDSSTNYLKIVDKETNDIISIARWHYYPEGFSYLDRIGHEIHGVLGSKRMNGEEVTVVPAGLNVEMHDWMFHSRDKAREEWMVKGPCWVLMHMVTRPSQRGRGAAGMLINWGVERAKEEGCPAYLEAAVLAKPLYEKFGFREVGEQRLDLRKHGVDMDFVIAQMAFVPEGCGGGKLVEKVEK